MHDCAGGTRFAAARGGDEVLTTEERRLPAPPGCAIVDSMDRRETERLLDAIRQARAAGEPAAMATVVRVRGARTAAKAHGCSSGGTAPT